MGIDVNGLFRIWKGEFADKYSDKPRLSAFIRDCELDVVMPELEEDGGMVYIVMYACNSAQREWIERYALLDMQEVFAKIAGLELLSLSVELKED